jgi:VWFA-related protein
LVTAPAQAPTFTSRREIVRVDALVTSGGKVVRDLSAADFTVLDSGVAQQVELVSLESLPLTVMLVFDASASVRGERLDQLREAGHAAIAQLNRDDQAGLVTFGRTVDRREAMTRDLTRVRAALDGMEAERLDSSGGTTLIDACYTALALADEDVGRTLLIVFTDGVDTSSWLTQERVLDAARRSNVIAYGVSTAPLARGSFLREFSDRTGGAALEVASSRDLRTTFLRILDEFRQRYVISFTPGGVPASGWHPLTVRARGRNVVVRARAGYAR